MAIANSMDQRSGGRKFESFANDKSIKLEGVEKDFNGTLAVKGISFKINPGDFVILLGPSGCGKSTTLRMVAGLEQATGGKISIGDSDVTLAPPGDRGLSMVFQTYALFPHLTVGENIEFGLKSRKVPKKERAQRLVDVGELVGLTEFLDRKPAQLSGGQRQRVALARAVISEHPICLMDEPLSNLDARLRGEMRREIKALQKRLNMTVIYVTHDQVEAMTMGDRVILLKDGDIVQDGTPDELYNNPASDFAASFIGSPAMNLVKIVKGRNGAYVNGDNSIPVAEMNLENSILGIRPEDIDIVSIDEGGIPATILDQEYLGSDTTFRLQVGNEEFLAKKGGKHPVKDITECKLKWRSQDTHVFSGDDGKRLRDTFGFDIK